MLTHIQYLFEHMLAVWYLYMLGGVGVGAISWLTLTYVKIAHCLDVITKLECEFKPNGGSSIKDALNRIEEKLLKLEFMKLSYLDIVDKPVFITNRFGKYVWVNKAYSRLVGKPSNELVGSGWENVIHIDDRQRVKEEWYTACFELRPFHSVFKLACDNRILSVKCEAYGEGSVGYFGYLITDSPTDDE